MALKAAIAKAVDAAFMAVGDIKTDCVFIKRTSVYTPSTGKVANTDVNIPVSGILLSPGPIRKSIARDRPETPINENEFRLMVKQSELGGVVPRIKDLVTIAAVNWTVEEISWDPAEVTYTFKIKKP
jgi:hypothetical protein